MHFTFYVDDSKQKFLPGQVSCYNLYANPNSLSGSQHALYVPTLLHCGAQTDLVAVVA